MFNELTSSIHARLETEFQQDIMVSSIEILKHPKIKTRFSNFATNIRELTRDIFHTLAPDEEVKNCEWYEEPTSEGDSDITRLQRMIYAIKGGLSDKFIKDDLEFNFADEIKTLNQVINKLNKYTHINEKVYYQEEEQGFDMVENTLTALNCFLLTIDEVRSIITKTLEENLHYQISECLTDDIINDIDILATHYWVDGSTISSIKVTEISSSDLSVEVSGSVDVNHQFGSDRDFTNGDGHQFEDSYPFEISLTLNVDSPLEVSLSSSDIIVDNSQYFE